MYEVNTPSRTIGCYLPEGEQIYKDGEQVLLDESYSKYIPVISGFTKSFDNEISFMNKDDRTINVRGVNRKSEEQQYNKEVLERDFLSTTRNDLTLGSDVIVLNFTSIPITINNNNEIRKTYLPLKNKRMNEFDGKIVIFEVTSLNTIELVSKASDVEDYINRLVGTLLSNNSITDRVINKTLGIYRKALEVTTSVVSKSGNFASNSIKVINMLSIEGDIIHKLINGEDLFIPEYKVVVSGKNITNIPINPYSTKDYNLTREELNSMQKSNVVMYINDPNDEITERYTYIAGSAYRIPKIKDNALDPMFYMRMTLNDENVEYVELSLNEMDALEYIFKTREDALVGFDRLTQAEHENKSKAVEIERIRHEREVAKLKAEIDKLNKEEKFYDKKNEVEVIREEKKSELELQREQFKLMMEEYDHKRSRDLDLLKFKQEVAKSNNDATLQTLKVVAGGLALAGIAYGVYKKLS